MDSAQEHDYVLVDVHTIDIPSFQNREYWDDQAFKDLVGSIAQVGILEPILIRPQGARYELVFGVRRLSAAKVLGMGAIPATVRNLTTLEAKRMAFTENHLRQQNNPLVLAESIMDLLKERLGQQDEGYIARLLNQIHHKRNTTLHQEDRQKVQEELDLLNIGASSFVNRYLPLLKAPPELRQAMHEGLAHYKVLLLLRVDEGVWRQALPKAFEMSYPDLKRYLLGLERPVSGEMMRYIKNRLDSDDMWQRLARFPEQKSLFIERLYALAESLQNLDKELPPRARGAPKGEAMNEAS